MRLDGSRFESHGDRQAFGLPSSFTLADFRNTACP